MSYQERDREIVDYQEFQSQEVGLRLRGPRPVSLEPARFFSCIGAAQTFGCFCERPYPAILADRIGLPALNLGYAGAGPGFFLGNDRLIDFINGSRFVVVQVLSGRSESNRLFDSGGRELLKRRSDGTQVGADAAYQALLETESRAVVAEIVAETRANWVQSYRELLSRIQVPTILLWFSKRPPTYTERYDSVGDLFGEFPQLVNAQMIEAIRGHCTHYVACVTERGSPQRLISRFTGLPTAIDLGSARKDLSTGQLETHNSYYPSPEMQADAAAALLRVCKRYGDGHPALRRLIGHIGSLRQRLSGEGHAR